MYWWYKIDNLKSGRMGAVMGATGGPPLHFFPHLSLKIRLEIWTQGLNKKELCSFENILSVGQERSHRDRWQCAWNRIIKYDYAWEMFGRAYLCFISSIGRCFPFRFGIFSRGLRGIIHRFVGPSVLFTFFGVYKPFRPDPKDLVTFKRPPLPNHTRPWKPCIRLYSALPCKSFTTAFFHHLIALVQLSFL